MKKILAIVLMTAVLVCPVLASGESSAEPAAAPAADAAQAPHYELQILEPATCTENGLSAYVDASTGETLFTFDTPAKGHIPSAAAPTCEESVVCVNCGEVLAEAVGHSYTYQYDAVRNADGSFASFGTWKCDNCGAVVDATEGNAVYYYGAAEPAVDGSAEAAGEEAGDASAEPAAESEGDASAEPAGDASAEPAGDASAEPEAAPAVEPEPEVAPVAEPEPEAEAAPEAEAEAEAAAPANPDYDYAAHNWAGIELVLALVIVVVGAVLMLSFGKKKG